MMTIQWEQTVSNFLPRYKLTYTQIFIFLRSSEEALEILQKFNYIDTRATIQSQLKTKYEPILHQFMKEVTTVENIFQVHIVHFRFFGQWSVTLFSWLLLF